jgi:formylglycine-generating enzyme required for sulfatase activity
MAYCFLFLLVATSFSYAQTMKKSKTGMKDDAITSPIPFTDSIDLIFVQGGSFDLEEFGRQPQSFNAHIKSFYIGRCEITQAQWKAVMHYNNSASRRCNDCPVENVTWGEVHEFVAALGKLTGKRYRLPTEAEWEYAAKGGTLSNHYLYSGSNSLDEVAWYRRNSDGQTHPVGRKKPNELGLYDMTGNVEEWCQDWDGYIKLEKINRTDPQGPPDGEDKIYRGGSFLTDITENSSDLKFNSNGRTNAEIGHGEFLGFRIVRDCQ